MACDVIDRITISYYEIHNKRLPFPHVELMAPLADEGGKCIWRLLAALRLSVQDRRYSRWFAIAGLVGCLFLAVWVPLQVWASGLALIAAGLIWHLLARRMKARSHEGGKT